MGNRVRIAKELLRNSDCFVGRDGYLVHSMGIRVSAGYDSWSIMGFLPIGFEDGAHIGPYQADVATNMVRVNHGYFRITDETDDLWVLEPRPSYHEEPIFPARATTPPFCVEALSRDGSWGTELIGGDNDLARCQTLDEARDLVASLIADQCREDEPLDLRIMESHESGDDFIVDRFPGRAVTA